MEIFFKFLQFGVESPVGIAGSLGRGIVVAQYGDLSHDLSGFLVLYLHHPDGIVHSSEMGFRQSCAFTVSLHHLLDEWEKDELLFFAMGTHFACHFVEQLIDLEQFGEMVAVNLLDSFSVLLD